MVSIIFCLMIIFNNFALKYVAVSFYMTIRSLSTVFNVVQFVFLSLNTFTLLNKYLYERYLFTYILVKKLQ